MSITSGTLQFVLEEKVSHRLLNNNMNGKAELPEREEDVELLVYALIRLSMIPQLHHYHHLCFK